MKFTINRPVLWTIIIFFCAAVFRLNFLDLMEFKLDEARDVYEMERFHKDLYLIQRGTIQSTGVYNPPLWYYFLTLLSLPSRDPQYLSFMIGILNCLAVAGFYWVVRKFYGHLNGIMAGLLAAFSPWLIIYSRKIWAPDLIMVLLVPLFYFLHKKNAFWVVLLLSLLAQLHASGIFITVITFIIVITFITLKRQLKFNWKAALLGLIVSLIPLLPYIAYQFQTGCEDCQNFFSYREEVKAFDINVFLRPFQLINGSSFQILLGDDYENFLQEFSFVKVFNLIFLAEFVLGILGIVYIIKKERRYSFLLIYLGAVPLLYLITQTPAHMHYFIILSPIMILIYILGLRWFKKPWINITIITIIIFINVIFTLLFYQFLDQKQNIQGDYGPIYRVTEKQAEEKLVQYKGNPDYQLIRAEWYVNLFSQNVLPPTSF